MITSIAIKTCARIAHQLEVDKPAVRADANPTLATGSVAGFRGAARWRICAAAAGGGSGSGDGGSALDYK